jgi:hypothetical protein
MLVLPLPLRTVFYDPMADVLGLVDHHIQHRRNGGTKIPHPTKPTSKPPGPSTSHYAAARLSTAS